MAKGHSVAGKEWHEIAVPVVVLSDDSGLGKTAAMNHRVILLAGYQAHKAQNLKASVAARGALVVDIRINAASPCPTWRTMGMRRLFGFANYRHIKEFGNSKLKEGGIEIADYPAGLAKLEKLAKEFPGRPIVMLCGCKEYETCHRKPLGEMLAADGFNVSELPPSGPEKPNAK